MVVALNGYIEDKTIKPSITPNPIQPTNYDFIIAKNEIAVLIMRNCDKSVIEAISYACQKALISHLKRPNSFGLPRRTHNFIKTLLRIPWNKELTKKQIIMVCEQLTPEDMLKQRNVGIKTVHELQVWYKMQTNQKTRLGKSSHDN